MKKIFTQILTFLLVFTILMANTGFVLVKHFCKMRGTTQTALYETPVSTCCAKKKHKTAESTKKHSDTDTFSKKSCCEISKDYVKADISLKTEKVVTPAFLLTLTAVIRYIFKPAFIEQTTVCFYTDSSPPLYGRSLLQQICILRI